LALQGGIETIYMACRNEGKAKGAKLELERTTGKSIFEIILMDVETVNKSV
jgi:hypothetical protein